MESITGFVREQRKRGAQIWVLVDKRRSHSVLSGLSHLDTVHFNLRTAAVIINTYLSHTQPLDSYLQYPLTEQHTQKKAFFQSEPLAMKVFPQLGYCKVLIVCRKQSSFRSLRLVQNEAACLPTERKNKRDNIALTLASFYWLSVHFRIDFKIVLLVIKSWHCLALVLRTFSYIFMLLKVMRCSLITTSSFLLWGGGGLVVGVLGYWP